MSDPTDNALAAIASILDQTTAPPGPAKVTDKSTENSADKPTDNAADIVVDPPIAMPPPLPQSIELAPNEPATSEPGPSEFAPSDPEPTAPAPHELAPTEPEQQPEPEPIVPEPIRPIEANGYSKSGPGPMAALRFRWTVREDDGRYFVDETVGEGSAPLVNGPMDADEAIKFVDIREAESRHRFAHFKREMLNRTATLVPARNEGTDV